ncbi:MAG: endonuclease III [Acidobacteria bacterium]|nr:endonuclease III [Acidobacteriota bacterium]
MIEYVIQNLEATFGVPKPRPAPDPLDSLIETILSQSTTDINSDRAFTSLKRRFPTWEQALRARTQVMAKAIQSGGLANIKSLRIKTILQEIYQRRGSLDLSFLRQAPINEAKEFLRSLDGVGPKTAACVLLFSCRRPVFPADTHILRVTRRIGLIPRKCSDERAHEILESLIPPKKYYSTHINLIRLGRQICRPQNPKCSECPVLEYCEYGQDSLEGGDS